MDSDVIAFADGTQTDSAFTRSVIDITESDKFANIDGVEEAAPLGLTIANAHNQNGKAVDLTLLGVKPDSFIAPEGLPEQSTAPNGGAPTKTKHEIVVSSTLQDEGIKEGDTITIDRLEIPLKVVGFTDGQRTFGHVDAAYLPLDVWQEIHAGVRKGEEVSPEAYKEISVIATLLTDAFFLVWTIQRAGNIAALCAMGATKGFCCVTAWARPSSSWARPSSSVHLSPSASEASWKPRRCPTPPNSDPSSVAARSSSYLA